MHFIEIKGRFVNVDNVNIIHKVARNPNDASKYYFTLVFGWGLSGPERGETYRAHDYICEYFSEADAIRDFDRLMEAIR